ncbi:Oxysterol-binding protein- protein 3 [Thoreauomyces humboldtii]|nr:Oxysterol-binding protein- protein 3 [Thoreauomyces humboldtii]
MQEVTIRQRSAFKHFVHVEQPGKELCWSFFTRRKSVAFGLYRKSGRGSADPNSAYTLPNGTVSSRNALVHLDEDGGSTTPPAPGSPPALPPRPRSRGNSHSGSAAGTPDTSEMPPPPVSLIRDVASAKSFSEFNDTVRRRKKETFVDPDLTEIMPVTQYDSSKFTVKGSHVVREPGTYVLLWDNTFSVNTSKKLFFFVALKDVAPSETPPRREIENWLLKKGNKKMQGFQKRWVSVESTGILSYYKNPGGLCRGTLDLGKTSIQLDRERGLIDMDTGDSKYFFKAASAQDYMAWVAVLQRFTLAKSMSFHNLADDSEGSSHKLIPDDDADSDRKVSGNGGKAGQDPDLADVQRQAETMVITLTNELGRLRDAVEGGRGGRNQTKDMNNVLNSITDVIANALSNANGMQRSLAAYGDSVRGQRERAHDSTQQTEGAFQACLADNNRVRRRFGLEPVTMASFLLASSNSSLSNNNMNKAGSISSSMRHDDEFFDAEEGGRASEESESSDSESMHEPTTGVSSDDDDGVDEEDRSRAGSFASEAPSSAKLTPAGTGSLPTPPKPLVRRTRLPAPTISMANISIMSLIRNNAGKDLSTVAMPIALNEPLNLLQKLCEELEYCELLDQAAATPDPVDRLAIMAAFAVSAYASTVHRAGRKPFNPLLGETYECTREDKGFNFVAEKVSHHPPVMACHAESPNYQFFQDNQVKTKFWGKSMELIPTGTVHVKFPALKEHYTWTKVTTCMRNVFSSNRYLEHYGTMKIVSQTTGHTCELTFKESGYFSSTKNEIGGAITGPNGAKLLSLSGNWDKSMQKFADASPNALEVLWRARPNPSHHAEIYGFTSFAVELNELTRDLKGLLPNTDTRYRPDQRMYEEGRADEAEAEKQRLEQKQREYRKVLETRGEQWHPQWFSPVPATSSAPGEENAWQYKGGYWENRGKFTPKIELW